VKRTVRCLILITLAACSGCISPDIAVIDMRSGRMVSPPNASMRQVVLSVDPKAQTFFTMVKQDSLFRLNKFDSACHKLSQRTVPVFTSGYCGSGGYALSGDGGKLVYLKDDTRNLYLFDFATQKETLVWEGIANDSQEIPLLTWISDSNIVAVLREFPGSDRRTNEVVVIGIPSGKRRTVFAPTDPASFDYALSPDGSLLAFADASERNDIDGVIKIVELQNGSLHKTLGSGKNLIGRPCWNPDGTELVFVEGRELKVWRIADNTTRTLHSFPDRIICYYVVFGNGLVGYVAGTSDSFSKPMVILNSNDGKQLRTINAPFNGGLFLLNGSTIVCEIGY
jgi:Tol biopolymer transport system component